MDDDNAQSASAPEPAAPVEPTPEPTPTEPVAETAPASNDETPVVEPTSQDQAPFSVETSTESEPSTDQPESQPVSEPSPASASAAPAPQIPQPQSPAQSPQAPTPETLSTQPVFSESAQFRDIQAHGRAKIQTSRSEKLDKLIQYAQKKQIINNEEIQMLLHVSSATATRYLVNLVQQGRLVREGSPRHAKYRFVR